MTFLDRSLTPWQRIAQGWMKLSAVSSRIFLNRYFYLFLFCLSAVIVVTEEQVRGAVLFVSIICLALVLCEDVLATTMPFLLLCVFVTPCYDSYDTFIQYLWMILPALAAVLFHFIVYRKPLQIGSTFWGLVAVSIALMLGGVGYIPATDYFRGGSLYYTGFLGIGMVVAYLLLKSQLCVKRDYDVMEKFLTILYVMGIFTCFMVFHHLSGHWDTIRETKVIPDWQPSNNASTFLMIAMPCPFFFVSRNRAHLLAPFLIFGAMIASGSRSGLLLGAIELTICLLLAAYWDSPRRFLYVCLTVGLIALVLWKREELLHLSVNLSWENLISKDEARFKLLHRAQLAMDEWPIFGHGLGYRGNIDLYSPKRGGMEWYHMMIPQICGSMGVVGILAYSSQLILQVRSVFLPFRRLSMEERGLRLTLAMCYGGLLIMSQVNPGIFCPLPYTLIGTMIFALLDGNRGISLLRRPKE